MIASGKLFVIPTWATIDENNSNYIGVVQPQNSQSHRPLRERSPLEEELIAKGYTVIDSQWITPVSWDENHR